MIAETSLKKAKAAFHKRYDDGTTSTTQVAEALLVFGCRMRGRHGAGRILNREFFETKIELRCLVRFPRAKGGWHWSVWDPLRKKVLDPMIGVRERFPSKIDGYYPVELP